jgi:hypothetical protein
MFFSKKIKIPLCRRPLPVALGTGFFSKKIKTPFLPTAPRQRRFQKPSTYPAVNGYFFWLTAHCGISAQAVPRASTSGARQRAVAEKKFSVRHVPSTTVGKAVADGLLTFAESLRLSAKAGFPVVYVT